MHKLMSGIIFISNDLKGTHITIYERMDKMQHARKRQACPNFNLKLKRIL